MRQRCRPRAARSGSPAPGTTSSSISQIPSKPLSYAALRPRWKPPAPPRLSVVWIATRSGFVARSSTSRVWSVLALSTTIHASGRRSSAASPPSIRSSRSARLKVTTTTATRSADSSPEPLDGASSDPSCQVPLVAGEVAAQPGVRAPARSSRSGRLRLGDEVEPDGLQPEQQHVRPAAVGAQVERVVAGHAVVLEVARACGCTSSARTSSAYRDRPRPGGGRRRRRRWRSGHRRPRRARGTRGRRPR